MMGIQERVLSRFAVPLPQHLFHYTSLEAMEGILSSGRIWASDIHRMNDASELIHPLEIIRERLIRAHDRYPEPPLENLLQRLIESVPTLSTTPLFAACFSADGDLLSQWRAYCPPEGGVSLGFDAASLVETDDGVAFSLSQCVYDQHRQLALIDEAIAGFLQLVDEEGREPRPEEIVLEFSSLALRLSPLLKHPKFVDEREWRISARATADWNAVGSHGSAHDPIAHYAYLLTKAGAPPALEWVIVGPCRSRSANVRRVEAALAERGLDSLITESEVPLRQSEQ